MKTFLVSAGHNNTKGDVGAVNGSLREADFTLLIRDKVSAYLKSQNVAHITDGPEGINLTLLEAINLEKHTDGVDIEFHLNAGSNLAEGTEALALVNKRSECQQLAAAVSRILGTKLLGDKGFTEQSKAGPHSRLGFCIQGGIILEVCFITNQGDMRALEARVDLLAVEIGKVLIALNS